MTAVKIPKQLIPLVENSKYADRIASASSRLLYKASYVARSMMNPEPNASDMAVRSRTKIFFTNHPLAEPKPGRLNSFPVELFDDEAFEIFNFEESSPNRAAIHEIIREGESLGIWQHYPFTGKKTPEVDLNIHQPARLVLKGDWFNSYPVQHDMKVRKPILNFLKKDEELEMQLKFKNADDVIMKAHTDFIERCELPTWRETEDAAKELVAAGGRNKNNVPYFYTTNDMLEENSINLFTAMKLFHYSEFKRQSKYAPAMTEAGEEFSNRRYTTFSLCDGWIRNLIKIKGERIQGVDATCLHPNILGMLCRQAGVPADFLVGDVHQKIADLLGINRKEGKDINLSYWNHERNHFGKTPRGILLNRFHEFMKTNHPKVLEFLDSLNGKYRFLDSTGKVVRKHANFSRILFYWESLVIADVFKELSLHSVPVNQCYDAIYVAESDADLARALFNKSLKKFGILTTAK